MVNPNTSVGEHALEYASQRGDLESVLEMVPCSSNLDLQQSLCLAASKGHFKLVSALLDNPAISPDCVAPLKSTALWTALGGQTALALAVSSLEPRSVQILLQKGADARKTSKRDLSRGYWSPDVETFEDKQTALHALALTDSTEADKPSAQLILDMLLSAGADLEARDETGATPIMLTIGRIQSSPCSLLTLFLSAGADPCVLNFAGESLLHFACQNLSSVEVASLLLRYKANPNQTRTSDGQTPLHSAMANIHSSVEHMKLLIYHGADVNARDYEGNSVLHTAFAGHSINNNIIETIIAIPGLNINLQNNLGQTCMHVLQASSLKKHEDEEIVRLITAAGVDLDIHAHDGQTVLHSAVSRGLPYLNMLLRYSGKTSVAVRTRLEGKTLLHLACKSSNALELVKMLVDHGANLSWVDYQGNTLLHEIAPRFEGSPDDMELVKLLVGVGLVKKSNVHGKTAAHLFPIDIPFDTLTARSYSFVGPNANYSVQKLSTILKCLDPELDLNAEDGEGYTPLHYASSLSAVQSLHLIQGGANVNAKAKNFRTPLHCAARGRKSDVIAMLLHFGSTTDHNIEVDAIDCDGRTPLHDACRSGRPESVALLIDGGADVNKLDKRSKSPLMVCTEFATENAIWDLIRDRENCTSLVISDPFRQASTRDWNWDDHTQHDTARIGIIAKKLLRAGALYKTALMPAWFNKSAELIAAIRQETEADTEKLDRSLTFLDISLTYPYKQADRNGSQGTPSSLNYQSARFFRHMDEDSMEHLLNSGLDFLNIDRNLDKEGTLFAMMARLGLTELMAKVIDKAKLFDDPALMNAVTKTENSNEPALRPLLQVASGRPIWNMEMIKILVEEGHVDVNARYYEREIKSASETINTPPGTTALHVLAKGEYWWQADALEYLIGRGAEVDALDEHGHTPLDIASRFSELSAPAFKQRCCRTLLKLGAAPNRVDHEGLTPLNRAGPDLGIVRILLEYGADVNAGTKGVIMSAVEAGDVETLLVYLQSGADCNMPDTSTESSFRETKIYVPKRYPIVIAACLSNATEKQASISVYMVKVLLEHGARTDLPVNDKETILHYLFQNARSSVLAPLIQHPGVDLTMIDQTGRTLFMAACESDIITESTHMFMSMDERARLEAEYTPSYLLLADYDFHCSSIDYSASDHRGRHTIFYLLRLWSVDIVDRFLSIPSLKSMILQKDNFGFSPLHIALKTNRVQACFDLMREGNADLLEPDPHGDTALHHISRHHFSNPDALALMKMYLSLGGEINARNNLGDTPLLTYLATRNREPTGLSFYVENDAELTAANYSGETALHILAKIDTGLKKSLFGAGGGGGNGQDFKLFAKLVLRGCDPLHEDFERRTALDIAATVGNQGIVDLYQRKRDGISWEEEAHEAEIHYFGSTGLFGA